MSYDLYFTNKKIDYEHFINYFENRENYKIEDRQALYVNEDTGVYFGFEFLEGDDEEPVCPESSVAFNMNFFRPHYFALEAEPEVNAFISNNGLGIYDPQSDDMGEGGYSSNGFLSGWNCGNEFGYRAILSQSTDIDIHTRATDELNGVWNWNFDRKSIQYKLGEDTFVPTIMFVLLEGVLKSAVVWPDAIPTLIPQVDLLLIPREEYAPRKFFRKKRDLCVKRFGEVTHILNPFKADNYSIPAYLLPGPNPMRETVDLVKSLNAFDGQLEVVTKDQVLNEEIVEKYKNSSISFVEVNTP